MLMLHPVSLLLFWSIVTTSIAGMFFQDESARSNWKRSQLVAWCIVPFDAAQRGPQARAEMVAELGIRRVAYDWREQHVGSFEEEIQQYQKHGIDFFAFWSWHPSLEPLIEKYNIHPQIWLMFSAPQEGSQAEMVKAAALSLLPMVEKTRQLNLKLGLYNHGGWSGEPSNMVAVCEYLRKHHAAQHVGIVYNMHHGHPHIADFEALFRIMQPFLLCVNLNGMNANADPKILPVGQGQHEQKQIEIILKLGYEGPVGILDHRPEMDSRDALLLNLEGVGHALQQAGLKEIAADYRDLQAEE